MANVTVKGTAKDFVQYLGDGDLAAAMIDLAMASLTPAERIADNIGFTVLEDLSTTKSEIDDTATSRPLVIGVKSGGTACYLHVHNADADNVTEGANADMVLPVGGTANQIAWYAMGGAGARTFWDTGLTMSVSSTQETSSAPANTPDVIVLYYGG